MVLLQVTVQHSWKTIQTGSQDSDKGDNDCLKEVKINEIMEKKFQDFDDQPLNMAPLNTGLTEIEMLKTSHKVLKINLP